MHGSNLYALDGLLILGVVLVCVTVYSGLRGLYGRSSAALEVEEDGGAEIVASSPAPRTSSRPSAPRRAA